MLDDLCFLVMLALNPDPPVVTAAGGVRQGTTLFFVNLGCLLWSHFMVGQIGPFWLMALKAEQPPLLEIRSSLEQQVSELKTLAGAVAPLLRRRQE